MFKRLHACHANLHVHIDFYLASKNSTYVCIFIMTCMHLVDLEFQYSEISTNLSFVPGPFPSNILRMQKLQFYLITCNNNLACLLRSIIYVNKIIKIYLPLTDIWYQRIFGIRRAEDMHACVRCFENSSESTTRTGEEWKQTWVDACIGCIARNPSFLCGLQRGQVLEEHRNGKQKSSFTCPICGHFLVLK